MSNAVELIEMPLNTNSSHRKHNIREINSSETVFSVHFAAKKCLIQKFLYSTSVPK
jgi:hypothetical protein